LLWPPLPKPAGVGEAQAEGALGPRREGYERSEGPDIRTHAVHLTPTTAMAFGLMLLLIGLMVEGRRTTWIYIGLIVLALVILWPIFIMLYRGYLKPQ
jgi:hypothetical protein